MIPPATQAESIHRPELELAAAAVKLRPTALERGLPLCIFLGCFAYLCIFLRYSTLEPDEGIVLEGAERILAGQIPYRDFFTFYTPGAFYLLAALFRVFGDSFAIARLSLAAVGAICSALTYVLARRVCSRGMALYVAVLATTAGAAFRFLILHNPYSTLGCCLSLYAAVRFLETRQASWAFAIGSLTAFTFLIEQSKGGGLVLGLALGFIALQAFDREFRIQRAALVAFASGIVWPLALTFAYFGRNHAVASMLQSWVWPLEHYTQANHVAYGYQNWSEHTREVIFYTGPVWLRIVKILAVTPGSLVPFLPLFAVGLLLYAAFTLRRGARTSADSQYYVLACSVISGLLFSVVIARPDILHFMYLAPVWYLVLAWILGPLGNWTKTLKRMQVPLTAIVATSFGLLSMAVLFSATGARNHVETRRGAIKTGDTDTVLSYVQAHVAPGAAMLVYPYLPLYNYLTGTRSPARYDYFQPGMNTSAQAEEIISALKKSQAPVLFEPWFSEKIARSWPQTPLKSIADDPISDYIARNYLVCQMLASPEGWRFEFMVRKEIPCQ